MKVRLKTATGSRSLRAQISSQDLFEQPLSQVKIPKNEKLSPKA